MAKDKRLNKEYKCFNVRLPMDTWRYLKKASMEQFLPMSEIVVNCIRKFERKRKEHLTKDDADVQ
jgi:hypothetical protein